MTQIDLSKLFWSKCRAKVLEKFFIDFAIWLESNYYMRALARDIWEQVNSVKRELDNLENIGLLKSVTQEKKKIFNINPSFIFCEDLKNLFLRNYNPIEPLIEFLKKEKHLELIIIDWNLSNRLFWKSNNIVDIFLIWRIDKIAFGEFLERIFFNQKIKFAIIENKDFYSRLEYNDKLIFDILNHESNIILKDEIWISKYIKNA